MSWLDISWRNVDLLGNTGQGVGRVEESQHLRGLLLGLRKGQNRSADKLLLLLVPDLNDDIAGEAEELVRRSKGGVRELGIRGDVARLLAHFNVRGIGQLGGVQGQLKLGQFCLQTNKINQYLQLLTVQRTDDVDLQQGLDWFEEERLGNLDQSQSSNLPTTSKPQQQIKTPQNPTLKMKSIFLLASLCLFALATSAAVTTAPSTHTLGLIRVTEALLLKEAEAQLKIYVIVPRNGEKLKLPIDDAQLAHTSHVGVTQNSTEVTLTPTFPHTGLGPSNQLLSHASNVVIEIWNQQTAHFIGGSIITLKELEQSHKKNLALHDATGLLTGIAHVIYEHKK
ncbi:hypothetical protein TYRP_022349 [Tyrophagus putrescentiae]|nr:hypothetical protein TYRP_022349 [Tyrophagus putrescentiae]